jgi:hypothetical protein
MCESTPIDVEGAMSAFGYFQLADNLLIYPHLTEETLALVGPHVLYHLGT